VSLSISDTADVQQAMTTLLTRLQYPVLTDLNLQFIGGNGELYPHPLPDLYADQPLMLTARVDTSVSNITVTADHSGQRWRQSYA